MGGYRNYILVICSNINGMSDDRNEIKRVADIFVEQYNKKNNTSFSWTTDSVCFEPGEPYDFQLIDGDKKLLIQVTRPDSYDLREYVFPNKCEAVISKINKRLYQKKYKEHCVYLNFYNPPKNEDEINELSYWLEWFVENKINEDETKFSWNLEDDNYIEKIKPYISEFEIKKQPNYDRVIFTFGWHPKEPKSWRYPDETIVQAVFKKEKKYIKQGYKIDQMILIVISRPFPIIDAPYYVNSIKSSIKSTGFKEVWLVDDFLNNENCVQVK